MNELNNTTILHVFYTLLFVALLFVSLYVVDKRGISKQVFLNLFEFAAILFGKISLASLLGVNKGKNRTVLLSTL
jgi:hypothetical protein